MEYEKCLVELDEILNYLSAENLKKIPEEILISIKEQKSRQYEWKYDKTKSLKEQNLNRKTIIMLSYLNMEYLLNEDQKKLMEKIHMLNESRLENKKKEKYNPDNIFKNNTVKEEIIENEVTDANTQMIKYKESFFTKIMNKIKSIFKH